MKRFFIFALFLLLMGCNEEKEIQKWIEETSQLRIESQKQIDQTPYRNEQYGAFKSYFSKVNEVLLILSNDVKLVKPFNLVVAKSDLQDLCSKLFLTKPEWQLIMQRCTKNRFFLCAEEVRAYPDIVRGLRNDLETEQQKRFNDVASCREMIE